jgi:hypothetical protein
MPGAPTNPEPGDVQFDGSEFAPHLRDVAPGDTRGLIAAHEGIDEAMRECISEQPKSGAAAGIVDADVARLQEINAIIARIDQFIAPVMWFLNKLQSTRLVLDDERNRLIYSIAESVDRRLKQRPELAARYEKTRAYRSAVALKGLLTRRRNAAPQKTPPKDPPKGPQKEPQKDPQTPATKDA